MMTKVQEISDAEPLDAERIKEISTLDDANDDDYTDVGSEDSDDFDHNEESILERFGALIDIIPPVTRVKITHAWEDFGYWTMDGLHFVGSGLWILSTASLLTLFPLALELEREGAVMEQESQRVQNNSANQVFFTI